MDATTLPQPDHRLWRSDGVDEVCRFCGFRDRRETESSLAHLKACDATAVYYDAVIERASPETAVRIAARTHIRSSTFATSGSPCAFGACTHNKMSECIDALLAGPVPR